MTGCLYISPECPNSGVLIPTILADTLVTFRGVEGAPITPATAGAPLLARPSTGLARKAHIVGRTAMAYAGEVEHIRSLHRDYLDKEEEWLNWPNPMRPFGDQAKLYRARYRANVEVLGIHRLGPDQPAGFNSMARGAIGKVGNFGMCSAIGSGEEDLLSRIDAHQERFTKILEINPIEAVRGIAGHINGARLAEEIATNGKVPNHWGGYVEYVYFDPISQTWQRGSKHLNLFYHLKKVKPDLMVGTLVQRAVMYDPGVERGKILAINGDLSQPALSTFSLRAPWDDMPHDTPDETRAHWTDWRPDSATVTMIVEEHPGRASMSSRTANPGEMQEFILKMSDVIGYGISDDLADKYFLEQSDVMGITCLPANRHIAS